MRKKDVILAAKILSAVFAPFYLPLVALACLLAFTYLSLLPWTYKLFLLLTFWLFTIFLPTTLIRLYRNYHGWTLVQLSDRERRVVPYVISIASYMACCYVMTVTRVPHFLRGILIAGLVTQIACSAVNLRIKISTHTAAIGGMGGALAAFSIIFSFNPVWWLCGVIMLGGAVGTSRMMLRQHALHEVVWGFLIGAACSFVAVLAC